MEENMKVTPQDFYDGLEVINNIVNNIIPNLCYPLGNKAKIDDKERDILIAVTLLSFDPKTEKLKDGGARVAQDYQVIASVANIVHSIMEHYETAIQLGGLVRIIKDGKISSLVSELTKAE